MASSESANEQHRVNVKSSEDETRRSESQSQSKPRRGGCVKVLKYIFFLMNFIIFCCGVVLFALGIMTLVSRAFLGTLVDIDSVKASSIILIISGVIMALLSFMGCCGAGKEKRCLLLTYFCFLLIIIQVVLTAGIIMFVFREKIDKNIDSDLASTIPSYGDNVAITTAWDSLQRGMKCCGVVTENITVGWTAWSILNSDMYGKDDLVPVSCCKRENEEDNCVANPGEGHVHDSDCAKELRKFFRKHSRLIGGVCLGFVFFLLLALALCCAFILML